MNSTAPVVLPAFVREALIAHARRDAPRECCGFLLGLGRVITFAVACANVEPGERRYRIDDRQHLDLRRWLRAFSPSIEIVGVYHSHPAGPARLSQSDIAEAFYPDWFYAVVGLGAAVADVRLYQIRDDVVTLLPLSAP